MANWLQKVPGVCHTPSNEEHARWLVQITCTVLQKVLRDIRVGCSCQSPPRRLKLGPFKHEPLSSYNGCDTKKSHEHSAKHLRGVFSLPIPHSGEVLSKMELTLVLIHPIASCRRGLQDCNPFFFFFTGIINLPRKPESTDVSSGSHVCCPPTVRWRTRRTLAQKSDLAGEVEVTWSRWRTSHQ